MHPALKRRVLYGVDLLVHLYGALVLHLTFLGGFDLSVGTLRISVYGYANLLVALAGLLALRRWLRGSFIDGFRTPIWVVVGAIRRWPEALSAWVRTSLTTPRIPTGALLAAAALLAGIAAVVVLTPYPLQGLTAHYFDNPDWVAPPVSSVRDRDLNLRRLPRSCCAFDYSIEWTGVIDIPATGEYRFATESDDGSLLWIDGELVVDNGGAHGIASMEGVANLKAGFHPIRLRYMQRQGAATLVTTWGSAATGTATPEQRPLSTARLFPERPSSRSLTLFHVLRRLMLLGALLLLPCCSVMLLGGCDLLLDPSSRRSTLAAVRSLGAYRGAATNVVELALLATLAVGLWVVVLGRVTVSLGIVEVTWATPAAPFLCLGVLFVLRRLLRGSFGGGFQLPPALSIAATELSRLLSAWLRRRAAAPESRARLVVSAILTIALVSLGVASAGLQQGLTGRYYDAPDWTGDLFAAARDRELNLRRPVYDFVNEDFLYSVEWSGVIHIASGGDYRFALTTEGASRLWIDDTLVVDNGGAQVDVETAEGIVRLTPGFREIRIRYAHAVNRNGTFIAEWSRGAEPLRPLSTARLFPAAPTSRAWAGIRLSLGLLQIAGLVFAGLVTFVYLMAWHWLLRESRAVEEHQVYIGLFVLITFAYYLAGSGLLQDFWGFSQVWGIGGSRKLFTLLLATVPVLAYRRYRSRLEPAIKRVDVFLRAHQMVVLVTAILSVLLFFALRSEFVNSDGVMLRWLVIQTLADGDINFDEMFEQYLHIRFWYYTNAAFDWSVRHSYQVASSFAGGAFVLVLWSYARRLVPNAGLVFLVLMVSGGYMQLFFGEVEHYSLVAVVILAYYLAAARFLQGQFSIIAPSAVLALAMTFHMLAGFLLPSLGVLYLVALRRRAYLPIGLALAASMVVVVGALAFFGLPIASLYQGSWGTRAIRGLFLSAAETAGAQDVGGALGQWAFFAFDQYHWKQYNLLALMFPAHLLLVPLVMAGRVKLDAINVHLVVACLGMTFFHFNYRALLAINHDWNLYANASIPLAILVWRNLLRARNLKYKAEIVIAWASVSFVHSYSWIVANHQFTP